MRSTGELSADDTAGILDQIYRAAQKGLPRRFCCTPEQLKDFLHRQRLRTEFLDQVGRRLEEYGLQMSYPRSSRSNVGFASWVLADSWQPASQESFEEALAHGVGLDRVPAATDRLIMIRRLNTASRSSGQPVILNEQQFCEIAQVERFRPPQWQELVDSLANRKGADAVSIFLLGTTNDRKFAITHQFHLRRWFQPSADAWSNASRRYFLEEED